MGEVIVNALPQTAPISDMRNRQNELLRMAEAGPVVLLSRSKLAAVLLSPVQWDAIAEMLTQSRQRIKVAEQLRPAHDANDDEHNVDAFAAIAALAQPFGTPDLSINFDTYTKPMHWLT
jgi:prevent-host-death family protein